MSTHEIEDMLLNQSFQRIHRAFIVAVNKIDSNTADEVGINGIALPIGSGY